MKKLMKVIVLIFIMSSFTSCDFKDIDRRVFIVAVGIDSAGGNGEIEVNFKAAIPKVIGKSNPTSEGANYELYSIKGNSIGEIFRNLKAETALEPDFAHMKMVVFGEGYAKNNSIGITLDFLSRRRDFQNIAYIAVGSPSAKSVITTEPRAEKIAGNSLFLKFGQGSNSQYMITTKLFDVIHSNLTPGMTVFCPVLKAREDKIIMEEVAMFDRNKLNKILSKEETKLFKLLFQGEENGYIVINTLESKNPIGININKGKASIKLKDRNDDILCNVNIKIEGVIEEVGGYEHYEGIEVLAQNLLNSRVKRLLENLQEDNLDPLQLQVKYWASHRNYDFSDQWLVDQYKKIHFNVDSKIEIQRSGFLR